MALMAPSKTLINKGFSLSGPRDAPARCMAWSSLGAQVHRQNIATSIRDSGQCVRVLTTLNGHRRASREACRSGQRMVNFSVNGEPHSAGKSVFLLKPVHKRRFKRLMASDKLSADERTAPVLYKGSGRTKWRTVSRSCGALRRGKGAAGGSSPLHWAVVAGQGRVPGFVGTPRSTVCGLSIARRAERGSAFAFFLVACAPPAP